MARAGVARLIRAHLEWVVTSRRAICLKFSRSEWTEQIRGAQRAQNARLAEAVERWRAPLVERGVIKPGRQVAVVAADVFCMIDGVEKHTATALASIAMLDEKAPARIPSPA